MCLPQPLSEAPQPTNGSSLWLRGHWQWAWFFFTPVLWGTVTLPLFDAIGIMIQFGRHAYFVDSVRVANHHHGILSNGTQFNFNALSLVGSMIASAYLALGIVIALQVAAHLSAYCVLKHTLRGYEGKN